MATWTQIANDPDFLSLPESEKRKVADGFYNKTIAADRDFQSLTGDEQQKVKFGFYAKSGFQPIEEPSKESFTQKLKQGAEQMFRPEIKFAETMLTPLPGTPRLTGAIFKPLASGIDKIQGAIAGSPTAEALTAPFKTALGVGKFVSGALAGAGITPTDILTGMAGKIKLALSAPEAIRAAEIARIRSAAPEVFQAAVNKLPPQEAMTIAELSERTGTPDKMKAAMTFVPPPALTRDVRMTRPLVKPTVSGPTPFTLQAGISKESQSALDAFRSRLPKGPAEVVQRPPIAEPQALAKVMPPEQIVPATAAQRLTEILKNVTKVRGKQDAIRADIRAAQARQMEQISSQYPGQEGYFKQLSILKGPIPKPEYESVEGLLSQNDLQELFTTISSKKSVPVFDRLTGARGLQKVITGEIPQPNEIDMLREFFPKDFVQTVLDNRSGMKKIWDMADNVLNLPKSMMSTLDLSMPFRQGALLMSKPKEFVSATGNMFRYAADEKAYAGLIDEIKRRPTYNLMRENGLALTDVGENLSKREDAFRSNLAEKIPVFGQMAKASNRAATGFLNKLRSDTFDTLIKDAEKVGALKQNPALVIKNIANFVNSASGRGSLGSMEKSAGALNAIFFSPRLIASRLTALNPVYYAKLDPFTRKEALKSLFTLAGVGSTMAGLAKARGADVGIDPRSADFGKIKIGNTRYDIWAGFQQYAVAAARLMTGEMVSSTTGKEFKLGEGYKPTTRLDILDRLTQSKMGPIATFATGLLRGQNTIGDKFDVPAEVIDRFIPMITQDLLDLSREKGFAESVGWAIPGAFGVGSQTYADQIPLRVKSKTGKEKIEWKSTPSIGGVIASKLRGEQVSNIPPEQQKSLIEQRKADTLKRIEMDKVKSIVIETGEPQRVGNTVVYLDRGVVRTREVGKTPEIRTEENLKSMMQGVSDELSMLDIQGVTDQRKAYNIGLLIKDPRYKVLSRDNKRVLINRLLMGANQ